MSAAVLAETPIKFGGIHMSKESRSGASGKDDLPADVQGALTSMDWESRLAEARRKRAELLKDAPQDPTDEIFSGKKGPKPIFSDDVVPDQDDAFWTDGASEDGEPSAAAPSAGGGFVHKTGHNKSDKIASSADDLKRTPPKPRQAAKKGVAATPKPAAKAKPETTAKPAAKLDATAKTPPSKSPKPRRSEPRNAETAVIGAALKGKTSKPETKPEAVVAPEIAAADLSELREPSKSRRAAFVVPVVAALSFGVGIGVMAGAGWFNKPATPQIASASQPQDAATDQTIAAATVPAITPDNSGSGETSPEALAFETAALALPETGSAPSVAAPVEAGPTLSAPILPSAIEEKISEPLTPQSPDTIIDPDNITDLATGPAVSPAPLPRPVPVEVASAAPDALTTPLADPAVSNIALAASQRPAKRPVLSVMDLPSTAPAQTLVVQRSAPKALPVPSEIRAALRAPTPGPETSKVSMQSIRTVTPMTAPSNLRTFAPARLALPATPAPLKAIAMTKTAPILSSAPLSNTPELTAKIIAPFAAPSDAPLGLAAISPESLPALENTTFEKPQTLAATLGYGPGSEAPLTVYLNAPNGVPDPEFASFETQLTQSGFELAKVNRLPIKITQRQIRYFHASDVKVAEALAKSLDAKLRDFTSFSPAPETGTIEVWMAGASGVKAAPKAAPKRSVRRQARAKRIDARRALRDKLINSLRRGDHL